MDYENALSFRTAWYRGTGVAQMGGGVSIRCRHKVLFSRAVRGVVRVRDLFRLPRSAQGEATVVCVIVRFVEAMSLVGLSGKRDVTAGDCPFASSSRATLFPPLSSGALESSGGRGRGMGTCLSAECGTRRVALHIRVCPLLSLNRRLFRRGCTNSWSIHTHGSVWDSPFRVAWQGSMSRWHSRNSLGNGYSAWVTEHISHVLGRSDHRVHVMHA